MDFLSYTKHKWLIFASGCIYKSRNLAGQEQFKQLSEQGHWG